MSAVLRARYNPAKRQLCISGDTFELKEKLKALNYKWDSYEKEWVRNGVALEGLDAALNELRQLGAEVRVSHLKEALMSLRYALITLSTLYEKLDASRPGPGRFKAPEDMNEVEKESLRLAEQVKRAFDVIAQAAGWLEKHKDKIDEVLLRRGVEP
jgi:DNA repair exonuclease SbcCD ATPase subunit